MSSGLKALLSKQPGRRQFMLGTAAGLLVSSQAKAWDIVKGPLPGESASSLWPQLAATNFGNFTEPAKIPADVAALEGQRVTVDGFQMAFDGQNANREFLLTSMDSHCPYCVPGGMASILTVSAASPVTYTKGAQTRLSGKLVIDRSNLSGFVYRLEEAELA